MQEYMLVDQKEIGKLKEWLGIHYEGNIYYKNNKYFSLKK